MKVMEGVTNSDLNTGLMLALATNSAAYFTHAEIHNIKQFMNDKSPVITARNGKRTPPRSGPPRRCSRSYFPEVAERFFDSTIDMKSNPTQIPDAYTLGDHPYSWSGVAMAGPFKGLTVFSNNVHAQNSDSLSQSPASRALFGMSEDVYIGTILQRAPASTYRYQPKKGKVRPRFSKSRPHSRSTGRQPNGQAAELS